MHILDPATFRFLSMAPEGNVFKPEVEDMASDCCREKIIDRGRFVAMRSGSGYAKWLGLCEMKTLRKNGESHIS